MGVRQVDIIDYFPYFELLRLQIAMDKIMESGLKYAASSPVSSSILSIVFPSMVMQCLTTEIVHHRCGTIE